MNRSGSPGGFVPPPYPYDRLEELRAVADAVDGGCVDLSVGTPTDPAPDAVVQAMCDATTVNGYPPSIGTVAFREAASRWMARRFDVDVPTDRIGACIGTKELVAGLPHWLRLRTPDRDTVLYPAVSYPSYAMGAELAGCRAVPVPVDEHWNLRLDAIHEADAARALVLWVNSPGNPAGNLDDLGAAAAWGRDRGVPVFSDECYAEFTWTAAPATVLGSGLDGVVAVHSLSKRSNLAGARAGFYAGDAELVTYLRELRKHAGFMVPGPVQAAAVAAFDDDAHVALQRDRYRRRLDVLADAIDAAGVPVTRPHGGFYLWVHAPGGDAWALARRLASDAGVLCSPGEFYGAAAADHVRLAVVQPDEQIEAVAKRLAGRSLGTD